MSADERSRFHNDWRSSAGLLTTGSDTDVEIYRKFGLPTHPAIDRASIWLSLLTETSLPAARDALEARGLLSLALALALPLTLARALANPYPNPSANANPHPNPSRYQARGFEWRRCRDTLRPLVDLGDLDLAEEIADAELGGEIAMVVVPRRRWWCHEIGRYYRAYYYLGGTGGSSKALVQPWY